MKTVKGSWSRLSQSIVCGSAKTSEFFILATFYSKMNVSLLWALHSLGNTKNIARLLKRFFFFNARRAYKTPQFMIYNLDSDALKNPLWMCKYFHKSESLSQSEQRDFPRVSTQARNHTFCCFRSLQLNANLKIRQNHWKQLESHPGCRLPDTGNCLLWLQLQIDW